MFFYASLHGGQSAVFFDAWVNCEWTVSELWIVKTESLVAANGKLLEVSAEELVFLNSPHGLKMLRHKPSIIFWVRAVIALRLASILKDPYLEYLGCSRTIFYVSTMHLPCRCPSGTRTSANKLVFEGFCSWIWSEYHIGEVFSALKIGTKVRASDIRLFIIAP